MEQKTMQRRGEMREAASVMLASGVLGELESHIEREYVEQLLQQLAEPRRETPTELAAYTSLKVMALRAVCADVRSWAVDVAGAT